MESGKPSSADARSLVLIILLMAIVGLVPFGLQTYSRSHGGAEREDASRISTDLFTGTPAAVPSDDLRPASRVPTPGRKLVMIDFYTNWCAPCQMMERDVYSQPDVQAALLRDITVRKLNPEKDPEGEKLARKFGVTGYPTILFLDEKGHEVYRISGYRSAPDFLLELDAARSGRTDLVEKPSRGSS